jgi:hypothetical protein
VLGALFRKDGPSNLKVAVGWAIEASGIAGTRKLFRFGFADRGKRRSWLLLWPTQSYLRNSIAATTTFSELAFS